MTKLTLSNDATDKDVLPIGNVKETFIICGRDENGKFIQSFGMTNETARWIYDEIYDHLKIYITGTDYNSHA